MLENPGYSKSVNLTISLCLCYILITSCVRLWIRKGAFGIDDIVIGIATVVSFGHIAAGYAAFANGLGTTWSHIIATQNINSLNAASLAGVVTFTLALYLSKCAMVAFLSRVTKTHSQIMLYHICNGLIAIMGVISLLTVTVDCPSSGGFYWAFHDSCPSQSTRWQVLTAFDIVSEVVLLVLPVHLVWGLHMPSGKKLMIIAAFYLRIPVIGLSTGRNYYTLQLRLPSTDAGLISGVVVIWLEVQVAYALCASTLSASKSFTESFNSGFGLGFARGKGEDGYGLSDFSSGKTPGSSKDEKSRNDSALESSGSARGIPELAGKQYVEIMNSSITRTTQQNSAVGGHLKLRPDTGINNFTQVYADGDLGPWREHRNSSNYSEGSDERVIVRETGYDVQHDRAPILNMDRR